MQSSTSEQSRPFEFWKNAFLIEITDLRASSLATLLTGVTLASDQSIFFHLHQRFFRDPTRLPEYPNDFAAWTASALGNAVIAERLANLNLSRSVDLSSVRREISIILAEHLQAKNHDGHTAPGREFIFCQPRNIRFSSRRRAETPQEFVGILRAIDCDSIGYHLFEPKTTPGQVENDFANWFRRLGYENLANELDAFDPYLNSLEDNRAYLIELIEKALAKKKTAGTSRA